MPRRAALPPWLERKVMAATKEPKAPREDWPAAYERVGLAVGRPTAEVRHTWLQWQKLGPRADIDGPEMLRAIELLSMPEQKLSDQLQRAIRHANALVRMPDGLPRFLHYHTWMSLHSAGGFPDSVMVDRVKHMGYAWELKRESAVAPLDQQAWLEALASLGGRWQILGVIYPSNEHRVREALELR